MIFIRTNISSIQVQESIRQNKLGLSDSFEKLSSGLRINRAADDAAGLAVSEVFQREIRGKGQAERNAMDAISMLQVAEGALEEVSTIIIRMKELAVQSSNGTLQDDQRAYLHTEFTALSAEIDRIADQTEFNGIPLLDGSAINIPIHIGTGADAGDRLFITLEDAHAASLSAPGLGGLTLASQLGATGALSVIDLAMDDVATMRAELGATMNRLQSIIVNLDTSAEMLSSANSRIRDADIARETSKMAQSQILVQAGTQVLSQANQTPELFLKLMNS